VEELSVNLGAGKGAFRVLDRVSFSLKRTECLSLVGESGCGKTMTALSVLRLLPRSGRIVSGRVLFETVDLLNLKEKNMARIRGNRIAMIFQDPLSALNPYLRVSEQLIEGFMHHTGKRQREALERGVDMLERVGLPQARHRIHEYPHRFSGGMLQRVMIAMAMMTTPDLIIADEPTSALDATIQAQTLRLMDEVRRASGTAVILISHDLGVVADRSDRIGVIYAGRIVEYGPTAPLLSSPAHPYMKALIAANPSMGRQGDHRLQEIKGQPPRPGARASGCAFAPRCPSVMDRCKQEMPPLLKVEEGHSAACWLVG
jgi:oligopeptide/dipeptide ABC transporter ATP-binding protein